MVKSWSVTQIGDLLATLHNKVITTNKTSTRYTWSNLGPVTQIGDPLATLHNKVITTNKTSTRYTWSNLGLSLK